MVNGLVLIADGVEPGVLVFGGGIEQLHHLARDVGQIDGPEGRGAVTRLDLRYAGERNASVKPSLR